jgi:hypothetical protein
VDPLRGRLITAFPPLAGVNGMPLFDANNEPVQTVLRHNTRRLLAGQVSPLAPAGSTPYPFNAGIASLRLAPEYDADPEDPQLSTRQPYYAAPLTAMAPAGPDVTGQYVSPFVTFGPSLLLVPGSERVLGPEPNSGSSLLIPYFRVGATPVRRIADLDASVNLYLADSYGPPNYFLDVQSSPGRPRLVFDQEVTFRPRRRDCPPWPPMCKTRKKRSR